MIAVAVLLQLQVMLMTLVNLATSLEDPFDPTMPDVLSFAEARDQILYVSGSLGILCFSLFLFLFCLYIFSSST
jgi:hypothetical protein